MSAGALLQPYRERLAACSGLRWQGRVTQVVGPLVESQGPFCGVGEVCRIQTSDGRELLGEVIGFRGSTVLSMPLESPQGIRHGDRVVTWGERATLRVGDGMLGRVLDGSGGALDSLGGYGAKSFRALDAPAPLPMERVSIREPISCGIRAIDAFLTCGRGQRVGIFGGSGVGKSTLIGMMARNTEADVTVLGLVGERGREVREFLERDLDENGRKKSVVIVATSNEPALNRVKGAFLAMSIAEHFRDAGQNVLLMMDSVTRFAMAQREIGLAVGEPPTTRGYTPSVFSLLPQLLERAGTGEKGSITGLFTVLVEADDMNDPIADATRSILDGHVVLTRELATQNHYPAIDVLESVSRLNRDLLPPAQLALTAAGREHLAVYRKNQDLINIGAYPAGSNPAIDQAIALHDPLNKFLRQSVDEGFSTAQSWPLLAQTISSAAHPVEPLLHGAGLSEKTALKK
jgi:flagellum-specific ATP synthase